MPTIFLLQQNDVILPFQSGYEGELWYIYYTDIGLKYSHSNPQGCIFVPNGGEPNFSITLPPSAPTCPDAIVVYQTSVPTIEWVQHFIIAVAPPPPPPGGWTRRVINLPFRRRRPSPTLKP